MAIENENCLDFEEVVARARSLQGRGRGAISLQDERRVKSEPSWVYFLGLLAC